MSIPVTVLDSVLVESDEMPQDSVMIKGLDMEKKVITVDDVCNSMKATGFQATHVGLVIEEINRMLNWRLIDEPLSEEDIGTKYEDPETRASTRCSIWLSFTSNMISSGLREVFVYLAKHKLVDVFVTSAGGIEEDIIKCLSNTYLASFNLNGQTLRNKGWNRIGNLIVPNQNYCLFEDFLQPILDKMLEEYNNQNAKHPYINVKKSQGHVHVQNRDNNNNSYKSINTNFNNSQNIENQPKSTPPPVNITKKENGIDEKLESCNWNDFGNEDEEKSWVWTPSRLIARLGREINDERSLCYWCYKNNIPIFCPGITDGSLGDNLYFHNYRKPGLVLDVIKDIRLINDLAIKSRQTGMIILGGGLPKHHVCNANLMRNGADYAVYINTGQEFDGSDSGASPDEAVSWGKIKHTAKHIKLVADASMIFPLIATNTFHKYHNQQLQKAS